MEDFLSNRYQRVVLNVLVSKWDAVKAGVPQGSILGPLLNLHGGYVKINGYLLQFLCHMTSDVKFSELVFWFIYIDVQKLYSTK